MDKAIVIEQALLPLALKDASQLDIHSLLRRVNHSHAQAIEPLTAHEAASALLPYDECELKQEKKSLKVLTAISPSGSMTKQFS